MERQVRRVGWSQIQENKPVSCGLLRNPSPVRAPEARRSLAVSKSATARLYPESAKARRRSRRDAGRRAAGRTTYFKIVAPPDTGPEHGDVRSVDVERNREFLPTVLNLMNIARGNERRHGTHGTDCVASYHQMGSISLDDPVINRFMLLAFMNAHDTPGNMIVNRSGLARFPNEGNNRETAIRLHMEDMLPIVFAAGRHLLRTEKFV